MNKVFTKESSDPLEERLSKFLGSHKLSISNDTDIISVCEKLNLTGVYMPLDEKYYGFILVNEKYRVIAIKESLESLDARFLIAHELGHYITAYDESKDEKNQFVVAAREIYGYGVEKPDTEQEMDYLGAAILVPKEQFMRELDALKVKYKDLHTESEVMKNVSYDIISDFANRYRVTKQLIIRRIAEVSYYAV